MSPGGGVAAREKSRVYSTGNGLSLRAIYYERDQGFDAGAALQLPPHRHLRLVGASHCDFLDPGVGACLCGILCGASASWSRRHNMLRLTADWLESLSLE